MKPLTVLIGIVVAVVLVQGTTTVNPGIKVTLNS